MDQWPAQLPRTLPGTGALGARQAEEPRLRHRQRGQRQHHERPHATFADRVAAFALTSCRPCWGTNDVATTTGPTVHRANLRSAVDYVRALPDGAVPVVQTPNPIDVSPWPGRSSLGDYTQTMREAAAELDVVLIDHHAHGTSAAGRYPPSLLSNGLHPNHRGHLMMAKKMIKDLRIHDPASRVCAPAIP
ncbi:SGNH/GDSL hydrolase family protein [Streptomyces tanashiensis]|uniref:SGNH/GDSL hydrolase family protein n=1 Tax=Streptomyces tanashiensis TaxID=67367 RepID=A0ABY6QQ38_9ACTN|nr:SGNH/GDSL hydrolase family protein [Streptomyces tanashiensis]UZX19276.1 SGNH/GDSL hydrolase family protein [Streptomyces tanashiensis]